MSSVRGGTEANPGVVARTAVSPKLVAVSGPSAGRAFAVVRSSATVGRHPTNDFVVDDPRVSGAHLELTRVQDRVRARDVGSTNGTWLGQHKVLDVELAIGGELTIGDTLLRLEVDETAVAPPLNERESFGELVGRSSAMRELFTTLERIAAKDLAVLVQGETGAGKEAVARAIHAASPRAPGPFVVVDATALPEALAEALLFGREKDEAAGVLEPSAGLLESAHGGTVFVDGVGELPPALQAKLLRVLERREVVRASAQTPTPIDVRVLSSTNRDLRNAIDKGTFREDLYFRLAQVRVFVPPLRQRREDLPLVCASLLKRAGIEAMIDVDALDHLASMPWPGNVRELENALLRAAAVARDGIIRRQDVAGEGEGFRGTAGERAPLDLSGTFAVAKERAIERFEKAYLTVLMRGSQGNLSAAARQADVARHHLRDLLKKRGLYGVSLDSISLDDG
ncbi:MAG: sigma 54-dependent Fis family transcriptional regulator [Labilithrix sp.]|nr:sigma 54-dependent Fis family transcriptional regulator [Labilithrix sp.]MCW5836576.1 sigma 54-dependent Fis family transcriptional regulator [Labilithrix sp.]